MEGTSRAATVLVAVEGVTMEVLAEATTSVIIVESLVTTSTSVWLNRRMKGDLASASPMAEAVVEEAEEDSSVSAVAEEDFMVTPMPCISRGAVKASGTEAKKKKSLVPLRTPIGYGTMLRLA